MSVGFMERHADAMLSAGYHILPIGPGTKKPQRCQFDEWQDLPEWQRYCDREAKPFELMQWKKWIGAGIGIACGNVCGIDIDVLDPELSIRLRNLALRMLGDTPLIRIGLAPKALLVYRTDRPFPGVKRHPIEALCHGQQFVAAAIHPTTQRPYDWPDSHPANTDITSLPMVTQEGVAAFLQAAWEMLPDDQRQASLTASLEQSAWRGPSDPRGTMEAIQSALNHIPNADLHWDDWFRVGMGLKGALGDAGLSLFEDWSAWSTKNDPARTRELWATLRPRSMGAGTIYWLAEQQGWRPARDLVLNGTDAEMAGEPHPAAAFLERIANMPREAATIEPDAAPRSMPGYYVPAHLIPQTGFLGDFVRFADRTAKSPQPFLAVGAALALLGAVAGRCYKSPSGLRTNFFGIGVADSGGGKDNARRCAKELLFAAGLDKWVGGEGLPSAPGLLTSLEMHPARVYQIDEFGKFLATMTGEHVSERMAGVLTMMTKLFTSAGETLIGAEYANQSASGGRPRVDIRQPNACIWGTTVPGPLWKAVEGGAMSDGSLARFLVFVTDVHYPDTNPMPDDVAAPLDMVATLQAIARGAERHDYGGDLAELFSATTEMKAYPVPYGIGVANAIRAFDCEITAVLRSHQGEYSTAVFARQLEHTIKVALIAAVSRCPARPVIEMADFEWARDLVQHCIDTMLVEAERKASDTPVQARTKKVLGIIADSGGRVTLSELSKKVQTMKPAERDDALQMLIESNQVVKIHEKSPSKQRPITYYEIYNDKPEGVD